MVISRGFHLFEESELIICALGDIEIISEIKCGFKCFLTADTKSKNINIESI